MLLSCSHFLYGDKKRLGGETGSLFVFCYGLKVGLSCILNFYGLNGCDSKVFGSFFEILECETQ